MKMARPAPLRWFDYMELGVLLVLCPMIFSQWLLAGVEVSDAYALYIPAVCEAQRSCRVDPPKITGLHPGWLPWTDRAQDRADHLSRMFIDALPLFFMAMLLTVGVTRVLRARGASLPTRIWCYVIMSTAGLGYLHEGGAICVRGIAACNFLLGRATAGTRVCVPLTWILNVGVIWHVRYFGDWQKEGIFESLLGSDVGSFLDHARGEYEWVNILNFNVLRMISFNMDYHWAVVEKQAMTAAAPKQGTAVAAAAAGHF